MYSIQPRQLLLSVTLVGAVTLALVASAAAGTFDGVYRGTQRTTVNNSSTACTGIDTNNTAIEIKNNHFTRAWGQATLSVDVAANGSFEAGQTVAMNSRGGGMRVIQIKGQITGGNLEADIGGNLCAAHISLKKM